MIELFDDTADRAMVELAAVLVLPVIRSVYALLVRSGLATWD